MHWRGVLLSTVLLVSWGLLPSCSGRQGQESRLKTETYSIKRLTIPDGSYPTDDPDKSSGSYAVHAAWEFGTAMSSEAYVHWVSSRLEPAFTPRANSQSPLLFARYSEGDEETIRIETSSHSGREHVHVTLDVYPD
jgi:hypothetical protein